MDVTASSHGKNVIFLAYGSLEFNTKKPTPRQAQTPRVYFTEFRTIQKSQVCLQHIFLQNVLGQWSLFSGSQMTQFKNKHLSCHLIKDAIFKTRVLAQFWLFSKVFVQNRSMKDVSSIEAAQVKFNLIALQNLCGCTVPTWHFQHLRALLFLVLKTSLLQVH